MKKSIRELSTNEVDVVVGGTSEYIKSAGVLIINIAGPVVGFLIILHVISSCLIQD